MRHVRLYKMTSTQGTIQRQFTSKYTGGNYARKLACIIAWGRGVCTTYAEEIEHGRLGFENGAAAYGADFDGGHGDGNLKVAVYTGESQG